MSAPRLRSVNALLTRLSLAAFTALAASLVLGTLGIDWAIARYEGANIPHRTTAVARLFERQVEEATHRAEEYARNRIAASLLPTLPARPHAGLFSSELASGLARYGYTFVALVDQGGQVRQAWTRDQGVGGAAPRLPPAFYRQLEHARVLGGYLRLDDTAMLVGGGAIGARGGARPLGFLVFGLPLDAEHLAAMGRDLATRVELTAPSAPGTDERAAVTSIIAGGDSLQLRQPLVDLFGTPIGTISATFDRHELRVLSNLTLFGLVLALLVGAVMLGVVWLSGRRLLVEPVRTIALEVEAMRQSRALHEIRGEAPSAEWELLRTAFNQTVRTLHDWQRRYRDVFDRAADALFLVEPSTGRVVDANPATVVLTGLAPSAIIGQPLPPGLLPAGTGQRVVRWRRPDGVTQTWGVASSEILVEGGPWILAAYRDLTGREAMAHAQKMEAVGSLAGGIAHDFNNLIGAMLTGTTAARLLIGAGHPAASALDGIEHAGRRAADLTRQLLRFSRHDPLRMEPVDLAHVVESVAGICQRTFDRRILIDVVIAPDVPAVLGDAGEIEQGLLNLCINARDAMPHGGTLRIEATRLQLDAAEARQLGVEPGEHVSVAVSDTGVGMSDEVKARLFEPFFTTKPPGKGTGLGLSLVYGVMNQLGGAVTVRSAPEQGTCVTLHFPALVEGKVPRERTVPMDALLVTPSGGTRIPPRTDSGERPVILLVDDEHALREMMRMVLDLSGFEVLEAADGESGIAAFQQHQDRIRVVLLDVQLPGRFGGAETLEQLRALDPHVPVILCTGFVREDELARMRQLDVEDVMLKPVDVNALLARLEVLATAGR